MYNSYNFAKNELELAQISPSISQAVLNLVSTLQNSEIKNEELVSDLFWKLVNQKNLTPLDNNESDWILVDAIQTHKRCTFLKRMNNRCFYEKAIVFTDSNNVSWTGSVWLNKEAAEKNIETQKLYSTQRIKSFPFEPKSFFVKVDMVEIGDELQPILSDNEILRSIWQYYDEPI